MTRTSISFALTAIAVATCFASAAEACISCNYVPEVVNTPSPHETKRYQQKRIVAQPQRVAPPAKQRIAKIDQPSKKVETVKKSDAAKPVETADATPIEENRRGVSATSVLENRGGRSEEVQVAQDVGCKKFFPTIGQTVTVPCE